MNPTDARAPRRLLVLAPQPFLEDRGTPLALRQVLRALAELGVETDVVTYPVGRDPELPGTRVERVANPFGIRSVPVGLSLRKLVLDGALWVRARQLVRTREYDAIQASEEAAFLAVWLARSSKGPPLPVIYDMQSSMPEQLADLAPFGLAPVRRALDRCERWLLSAADLVVTSVGLAGHAEETAGQERVREWWFHARDGQAPLPAELDALRSELEIPPGAPVVLYTGTFAPYQGLRVLVEAIPRVLERRPEAVFVMVGATKRLDEVFPDVEIPEHALRLVSRRPRHHMPAYYALADILVSPRVNGSNLPLKIFDYLGAGRAIVATDIPAHRAVLDDRLALLVDPEPEHLADGIIRALRDPDLRATLGGNALRFAREKLSWEHFVASIREVYRPILGNGRPSRETAATAS